MKKHLTDLGVERIRPPKSGSLQIFDLGYPGLAIRIGHGGAKSFEIFYRENGKLRRDTLGRWPEVSLAAARESWRKTREAIARGDAPPYRAGAKVREREKLFEFVVEEWLRRDQSKNKQSSIYQATRIVEHDLLPAWRGRMVGEISKRDVIALLDAVADRGAVVKANRVYAHAHRFFRWCVSREIIAISPMNGLEKPGGETSRDRVLSDDEVVKVWKAAGAVPCVGSARRLLMLTGARLDEL